MKRKTLISIFLIICLFALSLSSVAFYVSAGTSELELLKISISHLKEEVETIQTTLENLDAVKKDEFDTELQALEADITALEKTLNEKLAALEAKDKELNEKLSALEAKDKELNEKLSALEAKDKELNEKIAALEAKDKEINKKLAALEAKDKELSDKDAALEAKTKELEDKITALESKTEKPEPEDPTEAPTEKTEEKEKGIYTTTSCESSVAISAIAIVSIIGTAVVIKKKD
ncbi:MAG: hypothetical protein J6U68_02770 [Clostridia bacterium]|nr:hypothetical protein [Clostridia bacterium]